MARAPVKFDGRKVPDDTLTAATAVLAAFNDLAGTGYGPLTGKGQPSENLKRILSAMTRLDPPVDADEAERMVRWRLTAPGQQFWDGTPGTGVVFGANVVEETREGARRNGHAASRKPLGERFADATRNSP